MTTPPHPPHDAEPRFSQTQPAVRRIDTSTPHPARRYAYWLGGKDNFAADRASGDEIAARFPWIRTAALENRRFLERVVRWLATAQDIDQFLDVGTGIPTSTSPNVHQIAQQVNPAARIVYVDNDPIVLAHARALLTSGPQGRTAYLDADLRDPATILTAPELTTTLDLSRPVGLLLIAVLHFLGDDDDPYRLVDQLIAALAPGSAVVLSHATVDPLSTELASAITTMGRPGSPHGTFRPRTAAEVARFTTDLDPIEPGLVSVVDWRPDDEPPAVASADEATTYALVAVKP